MELRETIEGTTRFLVPVTEKDSQFPPSAAAVFFNPAMELSRDATVLLLSILRPSEYLDAMGATGARGLRAANEAGVKAVINDRHPEAVALIRRNAEMLGPGCEVTAQDVNALMSSRRFDAIDLDPFGSPAPFIDSAIRAARRFLLVTATDTAPLCGAHTRAGMRRYFSRPINSDWHAEAALRNLLGFVVRETVKYDRGIEPLFCFARRHYVRLHLKIVQGVAAADRTIGRIGYVMECRRCPARLESHGLLPPRLDCPVCGTPMEAGGPLWLGPLNDRALLETMQSRLGGMRLNSSGALSSLLRLCEEELEIPYHYDYHVLAKYLGLPPPPLDLLIGSLKKRGFRASRAHYSGTAMKTDAPLAEILKEISA